MINKMLAFFVRPWLRRNWYSEEEILAACSNITSIRKRVYNFFWRMMRDPIKGEMLARSNMVLSIPDRIAAKYTEELLYLGSLGGELPMLPYKRAKTGMTSLKLAKVGRLGLVSVEHNGKNLFFPKFYTVEQVEYLYRYYVEKEGILGTGILEKSPHSYVSHAFKVDDGDILLDVGCSEGLFALDNLDRASKVYLFETQKCWEKPNLATFSPYGDKVKVYNRFVGAKTDKHEIRLEDAVANESVEATYFIKMDIEGGERTVIADSERFLKQHRVKLACAAYHRQDDAEFLAGKLKALGYEVEFSDGYMLPDINGFVYPYFRKGMIYARNY